MLPRLTLVLLSTIATSVPSWAQGPDPIGRVDPGARPLAEVATLDVAPLDRPAIEQEDLVRQQNLLPPRFAIPYPVAVTPESHGTWEALDPTWSLWRLRVRAPGANHVNLGFSRCILPGTAQLMVYTADYSHVVRPFTSGDPSPTGELWTPVVMSHEIVVELYVPTAQRGQVGLTLSQVGSGYRYFGAGPTAVQGPDGSGACQIDVVCPVGNPWLSEIPCVAAISTGGSIFCTGFMVNNTAQDLRNFFITARHCGIRSYNAASLVVYWNHQNTVCGGPFNANLNQFSTGATLRADQQSSDMTLVEMTNAPNSAWGITYAGWDRSGADATSAVGIHHPSGDAKKISFENNATQTTTYLSGTPSATGTHVRVVQWDAGTTEPGSSGSPLFDQNHRVIGQLHGGYSACNAPTLSDWYGKFSVSWPVMSRWLDPLSTGANAINTLGGNRASATQYGSGCYDSVGSFFEDFAPSTFDLGGTSTTVNSIAMTPSSGGYSIAGGSNSWYTPTSPNLRLANDGVTSRLTLPFSFQYPNGATSEARMCANGFIWLDGSAQGNSFTPSSSELLSDPPRLCPMWMDLDPSSIGSTHFDVDPSGNAVYFTWAGVPGYRAGGVLNDIQCVIRSDHSVEFRWGQAQNLALPALVGYSPGNGAVPATSMDISASMPFSVGPDLRALSLKPTNRPQLGVTHTLDIENIPPGSLFGAVIMGFTKYDPGQSLASVGMAGCQRYSSAAGQAGFVLPGGSTYSFSLPVPNSPSLAGLHVYGQAATLTLGYNPLGALSSNGVDMLLDVN